ncbi:MAG: ATP-dependent zinc metalloprotease FtsH [Candidatus Omnitrophota bacterium]
MPDEKKQKRSRAVSALATWGLIVLILLSLYPSFMRFFAPMKELSYGEFYAIANRNAQTHQIKNGVKLDGVIEGELADGMRYRVNIPEDPRLIDFLRDNIPNFDIRPAGGLWHLFIAFGPVVILIGFWWLLLKNTQGGGAKMWSFGKSRARFASEETGNKTTFDDVAGVNEAKEELKEVIEFLKDPKRFQRLGGKIPKGVLLMGPPGSGKTLLAKAVAGEAGVPFLSVSGSDFVEMFVGVGAARIRDLFEQAKKSARTSGRGAIIFIDEIDAVGRLRFSGIGGGHDEREQTLNALLVEMDGFDTGGGIILMAASNRPDVLDPALMRPGRFDRIIVIDRPDLIGREEILKVHTKNLKLNADVNLKTVARQTPGFSGADLANLANEAALLAARRNKDSITMEELKDAVERVIAGPEKKSRVMSQKEKTITAYHESGHTLLALLLPETDPLHKVSIIPRGMAALGYTMQLPLEDRHIWGKKEIMARLCVALGGRAAEELIYNEQTTGAQNDFEIATEMARRMVCEFGMSEKLGNMTLGRRERELFLGRDFLEQKNYSDKTAELIDSEVRHIVDTCYVRAREELSKNKDKLELLAKTLLEKEVMDGEEVKKLLCLKLEENQGEPPKA